MKKTLTYPQWFALLALKHFSPERPCKSIRYNTLASLTRKGFAGEEGGAFSITPRGLAVFELYDTAPR